MAVTDRSIHCIRNYRNYKNTVEISKQMKVDPVVSNSDQLYITNQSQNNKILYLQSCKYKQESYIRDLQQSLQFNKKSISMLTLAMTQPQKDKKQNTSNQDFANILNRLNEENILLLEKVKKYYDELMSVRYVVLIQQQLRFEEKRAYAERSLDFQNNINQLRRYLQDKQQSFSSVVTRLKKYEDINQSPLQTKLYKLSNQLGQEQAGTLLKKLAEQRDKYKSVWQKMNVNIDELIFLRGCLDSKQSYEKMLSAYTKYKQLSKQQKCISFCQPTKHTTSNTTGSSFPKSIAQKNQNPNKQLIKLLKKQKLCNELLEKALNQAIQKNQELIIQNNILVDANIQLQLKLEKMEAKCCIMEEELGKIHGWRRVVQGERKERSEGGRGEREKEFEMRGDQHQLCLVSMKEDMDKLSAFVLTCVPKGHLIKSASNPNIQRRNQDVIEQTDDIQIQEL